MKINKTSELIERLVNEIGPVLWSDEMKQLVEESDKELNALVELEEEFSSNNAFIEELEKENKQLREKLFALEVLEDKIRKFNEEGW